MNRPYKEPTEDSQIKQLAVKPGSLWLTEQQITAEGLNDLRTKIKEDPLFAIKKEEKLLKERIQNNPIKMKKLREQLEKGKKRKHKKSHKKEEKRSKKRRTETGEVWEEKPAPFNLEMRVNEKTSERYRDEERDQERTSGSGRRVNEWKNREKTDGSERSERKYRDERREEGWTEVGGQERRREERGSDCYYQSRDGRRNCRRDDRKDDKRDERRDTWKSDEYKQTTLTKEESQKLLEQMENDAKEHREARAVRAKARQEEKVRECEELRKAVEAMAGNARTGFGPSFLTNLGKTVYEDNATGRVEDRIKRARNSRQKGEDAIFL
eukprot:TRINITY_DN7628_c0_g1_i6.p1 TRINITY_DN7628_c0_g1~~TRINITY_DN7628_c0_g1_i6.p1  ORF type:complete len:325 (-),score=101.62 TRINITY_DN7628_c0_g1_i6:78-1052(-)